MGYTVLFAKVISKIRRSPERNFGSKIRRIAILRNAIRSYPVYSDSVNKRELSGLSFSFGNDSPM